MEGKLFPGLGYTCRGKSLVHPETPRVEQVGVTAKVFASTQIKNVPHLGHLGPMTSAKELIA